MEHAYIPSDGEINMGSASQDLYYSYNLYKLLNNSAKAPPASVQEAEKERKE